MPACERLETDLDMSLACMSEPDTAVDHGQDSTLGSIEPVQIADLPENVVRTIALHTLQSGGRQNSILSLLSMCGVCKRWRSAASCLTPGSSLLYDGTKATGTASSTMEQKYKTLPKPERTRILHAAATLFRGVQLMYCLSLDLARWKQPVVWRSGPVTSVAIDKPVSGDAKFSESTQEAGPHNKLSFAAARCRILCFHSWT